MKNKLLYSIILISLCKSLQGQAAYSGADTMKVNNFLLDFTISDMPAYKVLGTNPSEILRPADVKKFAVMLDAFRSGTTAVIPKSFALEVAPWKLASKNVSFGEYRNSSIKRMLYNTSFSLGTASDASFNASQLAVGARFKILGKNADFITDTMHVQNAFKVLDALEKKRSEMQDNWRITNHYSVTDYSNPEVQKQFNNYFASQVESKYRMAISDSLEDFNKNNWNAGRIDAAVAWLGASPDSLAKNIYFSSLKVWVTASTRPSKKNNHTQIMVGLVGSYDKKMEGIDQNYSWAANLRYYEGMKDFHGFLEFQVKDDYTTDEPNTLINLGAEIRIQKSFWIVFSGGIDNVFNSDATKRFISGLDLRYAFNK